MDKKTKRGFDESDKKWFSKNELLRLKKAHEEIKWLLDRDYKIDSVVTFIGDRYQFSLRQRNALKRSTSSSDDSRKRKLKELTIEEIKDNRLNIDGFNLIINLEVALSGGTLIMGNDNNLRDLAGLRGTYKLIDKTELALDYIYKFLRANEINHIKFYLDAPVSNSGRLKIKILEYAKKYSIDTIVALVNNADIALENLEYVVSSDAVVIDKSKNYFNMSTYIINQYIEDANIVNFTN